MNKPQKLTQEWVREHFPASVAIADFSESIFGEGSRLKAAEENGHVLGKFTEEADFTGEQARCGLLGIRYIEPETDESE